MGKLSRTFHFSNPNKKSNHLIREKILSRSLCYRTPSIAISLMLFFTVTAHSATFNVSKTLDTADGICDADCSLREAIIAANATPGMDAINLPAGIYTLTIAGISEDAAATGDLDITDDLTLSGIDQNNTIIDGGGIDRVFHVDPSDSNKLVNISKLSIVNGDAPDMIGSRNYAGGGIGNHGILTLTNVTLRDNYTGVAAGGGYGIGGGLYNDGFLTLDQVVIRENHAGGGGGVWNEGILDVTNSIITNHYNGMSIGGGGGLWNLAYATVQYSTISSNNAGRAGGILNGTLGEITIQNSVISKNTARGAYGGGIYNEGYAVLKNSTLSGNSALTNGGGISNENIAHLTNVTISNNIAGQGGGIYTTGDMEIKSSIIASNTNNCAGFGTISSLGYNLDDTNLCGFAATGDLVNTNPLLGTLQDNGGPTFTQALLTGSPAIDTGNPGGCTNNSGAVIFLHDQRGYVRPVDGDTNGSTICDIGAFEAGSVTLQESDLSITKSDTPDPITVGNTLMYSITVNNNGPGMASNLILVDTLPPNVTYQSYYEPGGGFCYELMGTVTCSLDDLLSGDSALVEIYVFPSTAGTITNTANISAFEPDPNGGNNTATEETTVEPIPTADLTVTISDSPDPLPVGNTLSYTITVTNNGPNNSSNVTVTDTLPVGVSFVSSSASQGTCNGTNTITCNLGTLLSGSNATVTIDVTPSIAGEISNTTNVTSSTADLNPSNNSSTEITTINGLDLSVNKTDSLDPVPLGDNVIYTITISNNGPDTATGVIVTDTLPSEVVFISAVTGQGTCNESGGVITCNMDDLPNDSNEVINITVATVGAGLITNSANVNANEVDTNPSNNIISETTNVIQPGTLQFDSASYVVDESVGIAVVNVIRSGGSEGAITVVCSSSNGTAVAGSDFSSPTDTLSWSDGDNTSRTFQVTIIDDNQVEGNETVNIALTNPTSGATLGTNDLAVLTITDNDSVTVSGDGGGGGGGCFIATAAYGSYEAPVVKLLRQFRDDYLLTNNPGRLFVDVYYRHSPPAARWLEKHGWAKPVVQILLIPIVAIAWFLLKLNLLIQILAIVLTISLIGSVVRLRRRETATS